MVAPMEDAFTSIRTAGAPHGAGDPVAEWRRAWERDVAAAEGPDGDARVALSRRDYGSYLFLFIDLVLAIVGAIALSIPLIVLTAVLFLVTGHSLVVNGQPSEEFVNWLMAPLFTLLGLFVTDGAMLLVLWYRLARVKLSWAALGLGAGFWRAAPGRVGPGRAMGIGLAVGVVGLVVSSALGGALQRLGLDESGQDKLLIEPLKHAPLVVVLAMVFAGTFIAPAVEELFFRGYVFRAVAIRRGAPLAYLISAATFAAFHLAGGGSLLPILPGLFVIGLMLCFAYHRTGNLLADITAHAVNNGAAFLLALVFHL